MTRRSFYWATSNFNVGNTFDPVAIVHSLSVADMARTFSKMRRKNDNNKKVAATNSLAPVCSVPFSCAVDSGLESVFWQVVCCQIRATSRLWRPNPALQGHSDPIQGHFPLRTKSNRDKPILGIVTLQLLLLLLLPLEQVFERTNGWNLCAWRMYYVHTDIQTTCKYMYVCLPCIGVGMAKYVQRNLRPKTSASGKLVCVYLGDKKFDYLERELRKYVSST